MAKMMKHEHKHLDNGPAHIQYPRKQHRLAPNYVLRSPLTDLFEIIKSDQLS